MNYRTSLMSSLSGITDEEKAERLDVLKRRLWLCGGHMVIHRDMHMPEFVRAWFEAETRRQFGARA